MNPVCTFRDPALAVPVHHGHHRQRERPGRGLAASASALDTNRGRSLLPALAPLLALWLAIVDPAEGV